MNTAQFKSLQFSCTPLSAKTHKAFGENKSKHTADGLWGGQLWWKTVGATQGRAAENCAPWAEDKRQWAAQGIEPMRMMRAPDWRLKSAALILQLRETFYREMQLISSGWGTFLRLVYWTNSHWEEWPNSTLVPSVWTAQHLSGSLSYKCTCTMCFC